VLETPDKVKCLGLHVTALGITTDPDKVQKVLECCKPINPTEIKSFLTLAKFYRAFIQGYAGIAAPMVSLLAKGVPFEWKLSQDISFELLKKTLASPPLLINPNLKPS
jgi:hypothetical protein